MDRPARRRLIAACAGVLLAAACSGGNPWPQNETGVFALRSATPRVAARMTAHAEVNGSTTLDIVQYTLDRSKVITRYVLDRTRYMHLIVVGDDFAAFMHLHPKLDEQTGHFTLPVNLESGHRYYAYADSMPAGIGQQVFRFVLQAGAQPHSLLARHVPIRASSSRVAVGPYVVTLATTTLHAGENSVPVTIARSGRPASGLIPYLGAAAHAVVISTWNLSYVHVHPAPPGSHSMTSAGSMRNMDTELAATVAGPRLKLEMPPLSSGTYKLWLQFRDKRAVWTAPFTIVAQ